MNESVENQLRSFISERFLYGRADVPLASDTSLLGEGVIDSTGVLELVAYLEERFGIEVDDFDVVPENLDSIARIESYLARKRG